MSSSKRNRILAGVSLGLVGLAATACDSYVTVAQPAPSSPDGGSFPGGRVGFDASCGSADGGVDLSGTVTDGDEPPIAGGTLLVTRDAHFVIASDPDEDAVYVVDRATHTRHRIALLAHDEPGRLAEDGEHHVHVLLRRAGAIARIDPVSATILSRDTICGSPRGLAYHAATDTIRVACMDGTLLTLPAAGGPPTARVAVADDLRDVAFDSSGAVYITTFRHARLLRADGVDQPFTEVLGAPRVGEARIAWRMQPLPGGGAIVMHQLAGTNPIDISGMACSAYSGGEMAPVVETAFSIETPSALLRVFHVVPGAPLPVDVAVSADGSQAALAAAGNGFRSAPDVIRFSRDSALDFVQATTDSYDGQAIAVAYAPDNGHLIVQTRAPAAVYEAARAAPFASRSARHARRVSVTPSSTRRPLRTSRVRRAMPRATTTATSGTSCRPGSAARRRSVAAFSRRRLSTGTARNTT